MHVRQPADDGFVEYRVVVDGHRRVFRLHLGKHFAHAAFVAASCGLHRKAVHGLREVDRPHVHTCQRRIAVDDGAVAKFVDLGERADVSGRETIRFGRVFTL